MITQTKKFTVSFAPRTRVRVKSSMRPTFYTLAKKHIVKGKAGGARDLSLRIDEIAYGL